MAAHYSTVRTLLVGLLAFPVIAVAAYAIAVWVAPPVTREGHHPVMPIGQAMLALAVGAIGSLVAMIADRHRQHRAVERAYSLDQFVPKATAREVPREPAP